VPRRPLYRRYWEKSGSNSDIVKLKRCAKGSIEHVESVRVSAYAHQAYNKKDMSSFSSAQGERHA
jgi:hypothetical protein